LTNPEAPVVLVAEDEPLLSMTLEDILNDANIKCVVVVSPQEAIAALEEGSMSFCALLTDIRMPGDGNGWDVARRARELHPTMPIIYMTGDSAIEWRSQGVPGSVMLQKPFADAQMITALTTLLNEEAMLGVGR
jgi:CheY-like chemotaxis protein